MKKSNWYNGLYIALWIMIFNMFVIILIRVCFGKKPVQPKMKMPEFDKNGNLKNNKKRALRIKDKLMNDNISDAERKYLNSILDEMKETIDDNYIIDV